MTDTDETEPNVNREIELEKLTRVNKVLQAVYYITMSMMAIVILLKIRVL